MSGYTYITLRERPQLKKAAAEWFHCKWQAPQEAYLACMEAYLNRSKGIAGRLLHMVVDDMKSRGITPIYLVTDHTGFYERYGWKFLCMVQGNDEPDMTRMYIHG